jgi:hypothetical protein
LTAGKEEKKKRDKEIEKWGDKPGRRKIRPSLRNVK